MAAKPKSAIEELQEKLTSAIKENTRAQAEALKASTAEGAEIRRLKKDTAAIEKNAAFMERDLGKELGQSLAAPFKTLTNLIPKPLKILASMPIQAMMRGATAAKAPPPRVDASGTPIYPKGGEAITEARGREMSQKGYYKGGVAASMAQIPGVGMLGKHWEKKFGDTGKGDKVSERIRGKLSGWMGFSDADPQKKTLEKLTDIDNTLDAMFHLMAYGPSVYTHDIGVHERLDKILAGLGAVDRPDYLEGEIIPDRPMGRSLLGTDPSVPLLGMDPSVPMLPAPPSVPLLEDGTMSNELGTFLTAATTKGSIFTHDAGLMGKMDEFIELFSKRMSMDSKDSTRGSARLKEDEASERSADKKEGKATTSWRSKLLGMFGKGGGTGGVMGWLGGKAKAGLGKGIGAAGKWIGGGMGALGVGKVGAGLLAAKTAAGTAAAATTSAVSTGAAATTAAAGGASAAMLATAILAPIGAMAMAGKDAYDLFTSKEERESKAAENWGGITGAGIGATIGGFIGVLGGPLGIAAGIGIGGMLGNFIGETFGKSLDKAVDKQTRAQLTALGRRYDDIDREKKAVMQLEISNLEKQKRLLLLDEERDKIDEQIKEVKERQNNIKKKERELRSAEYKQELRDLEDEFEGGRFGAKAIAFEKEYHANVQKLRDAEKGRINLSTDQHAALLVTVENQEKTLSQLMTAGMAGSQVARDAAAMKEAFLDADNTLSRVDLKGWGDESELNKILKKAEQNVQLSDVEQQILDEYNEHQKKFIKAQEGEVGRIKGDIDELQGKKSAMDTGEIDWKSMYVEQNVPWKAAMQAKMATVGPEGQQVGFHQRPTNVVDIYNAPKDSLQTFTGREALDAVRTPTGVLETVTGIDTLSAAAAGAGITPATVAAGTAAAPTGTTGTMGIMHDWDGPMDMTDPAFMAELTRRLAERHAAQSGAVSDTTKQAAGMDPSDVDFESTEAVGKTTWITGTMGTLYFNQAQLEKQAAMELYAKATQREAAEIKRLAEEKLKQELTELGVFSGSAFFMSDDDPRKAKYEAQEKKIEDDYDKVVKKNEKNELIFLNIMKRNDEHQQKLKKSWAAREDRKKEKAYLDDPGMVMDDEAADVAAQQAALESGDIHRQYYGKDKPFTGMEDTLGEGDAGRASSDAAIAGMLKDAKPVEGKIKAGTGGSAEVDALIQEGIEIQKRIAKSKGMFSNVYKGSDKKGRAKDQVRLNEIKKQVKEMQAAPVAAAVSDTTATAADAGEKPDLAFEKMVSGYLSDPKNLEILLDAAAPGENIVEGAAEEAGYFDNLTSSMEKRRSGYIEFMTNNYQRAVGGLLNAARMYQFLVDDPKYGKEVADERMANAWAYAEKILPKEVIKNIKSGKVFATLEALKEKGEDAYVARAGRMSKEDIDLARGVLATNLGRTDREGGAPMAGVLEAGADFYEEGSIGSFGLPPTAAEASVSDTTATVPTTTDTTAVQKQAVSETTATAASKTVAEPAPKKSFFQKAAGWFGFGGDDKDEVDEEIQTESTPQIEGLLEANEKYLKNMRKFKLIYLDHEKHGRKEDASYYKEKHQMAGDKQYEIQTKLKELGVDVGQIDERARAIQSAKTYKDVRVAGHGPGQGPGELKSDTGAGQSDTDFTTPTPAASGMRDKVKSFMGGDPTARYRARSLEEGGGFEQVPIGTSVTQQQAQAKTAVLNQGATTAAAQAGQGGGTNVTVVAPTTANSSTTVQNIGTNDMNSSNPRPHLSRIASF